VANYSPNAKSLLYTLSDFWTLYFRETSVLEGLYRGTEIEVGQAYLDLMALLLNNSIQDTTLFDTDYFKLIRLREDIAAFSSDAKYHLALDTDVAGLQYLHDRIFEPTAALERNLDFIFDPAARDISLSFDPLAAYFGHGFGDDNSAFFVELVAPGAPVKPVELVLVDAAVSSPALLRTESATVVTFTLTYAGPSNGALHTTAQLVSLLNSDPQAREFLTARLAGLATGAASPVAGTHTLSRQATAPLRGFATRTFDVAYGTAFYDGHAGDWLETLVEKGDVLRIFRGPQYGESQEFPVSLLRSDALYLYPQVAPANLPGGLEYVILRSPADDLSQNEPVPTIGTDVFVPAGAADAGTMTFVSVGANFNTLHRGQVLTLASPVNIGDWIILDVLDANTVVLGGAALVTEAGIPAELRLVHSSTFLDGGITPNGDGTAEFASPSMSVPDDLTGTVLLLDLAGVQLRLEVLERLTFSSVLVRAPSVVAPATGLRWAFGIHKAAPFYPVFSSPNAALPVPGTMTIAARRFLDGGAVLEGRDFAVDYDLGLVTPRTLWNPGSSATLSYQYREIVYRPQDGDLRNDVDGAVLSATELASVGLAFTQADVGARLTIFNSGTDNDGEYVIAEVYGATAVRLAGRTLTVPDPNDGFLDVSVYQRGRAVTQDVVETVTEIGAWAPNAQIDKFHLYFTYGYLINRVQVSSEGYRALIRGVFQLFMLGPTLERFEAAINAVAGLETIRDDGELFLYYDPQSGVGGSGGVFDGNANTFTDAGASFAPVDIYNRLYVTSGFNANRLFTIVEVLSTTTIRVAEIPVTDTGVVWELTASGEHSITTSRATYSFSRTVPLKEKFLTPSNEGVLTLHAFEVITNVFTVTDYVETPKWWEFARIPPELWPGADPQRRQSTPALFENVAGASDNPLAGDPGLYAGANDLGVPLEHPILTFGGGGTYYPDPAYPVSTSEVFFDHALFASLTFNPVGNTLRVGFLPPYNVTYEFRIVEQVAPTRLKLESYASFSGDPPPVAGWQILTGTIPMRHNAAYAVLDLYLKTHVFSVRFDTYLFNTLATDVITDLQELVFVAKPSYTYLLLTPASLFDEVFRITDTLEHAARYQLGGTGGDTMAANLNPLRAGDGWLAGSWFRYVDFAGSFATPAATLPEPLDTPRVGYQRLTHQFYVDPPTMTENGSPVPFDDRKLQVLVVGSGTVTVNPSYVELTAAAPIFEPDMTLFTFEIAGSASNDGFFLIGTVINSTTIQYQNSTAAFEAGVNFAVMGAGGSLGVASRDAEGVTTFTRYLSGTTFTAPDVGTYIRRPFVTANFEQSYEVLEVLSSDSVRIGTKTTPYTGLAVSIASNQLSFVPGEFIVSGEQCYVQRAAMDLATSRAIVFYALITAGPDAGAVRRFHSYVSSNTVLLEGSPLTDDAASTVTVYFEEHVTTPVFDPGGEWEHLFSRVYVDNYYAPGPVTLDGTEDAGTADFQSFGVEMPIDPVTATFSEASGDNYLIAGGIAPVTRRFHRRTSRDMDLFEAPISVSRTPTEMFGLMAPGGDGINTPGGDGIVVT